jgi:hypothetical protein
MSVLLDPGNLDRSEKARLGLSALLDLAVTPPASVSCACRSQGQLTLEAIELGLVPPFPFAMGSVEGLVKRLQTLFNPTGLCARRGLQRQRVGMGEVSTTWSPPGPRPNCPRASSSGR